MLLHLLPRLRIRPPRVRRCLLRGQRRLHKSHQRRVHRPDLHLLARRPHLHPRLPSRLAHFNAPHRRLGTRIAPLKQRCSKIQGKYRALPGVIDRDRGQRCVRGSQISPMLRQKLPEIRSRRIRARRTLLSIRLEQTNRHARHNHALDCRSNGEPLGRALGELRILIYRQRPETTRTVAIPPKPWL